MPDWSSLESQLWGIPFLILLLKISTDPELLISNGTVWNILN